MEKQSEFVCEECGKVCKTKFGLVGHSRTHEKKEMPSEEDVEAALAEIAPVETVKEEPVKEQEVWDGLWKKILDGHARRAIMRAKHEYEGGFKALDVALNDALNSPEVKANGAFGKPINDILAKL